MATVFANRRVADLFSVPTFRPLLTEGRSQKLDETIKEFRGCLELPSKAKNIDVVVAAYQFMSKTYRSEYFYKNFLANKFFLGTPKGAETTLLNEFRIGNAVADAVHINGEGVVYEIKTEFDSPSKLSRQIENYYKAFGYVNVVIHERMVAKYLLALENMPVGLLSVSSDEDFNVIKEPQYFESNFNLRTMFNVLRLSEVTQILRDWYGSIPDVPNGIRYSTFLSLAKGIPDMDFQKLMQNELKSRTLRSGNCLSAHGTPLALKSVLIQLDPTPEQNQHLVRWLAASGD